MMNHPTNHGSGPVPTTTPARPSKHRSTAERQTAPRRSTSAAVAIVTLAAAFAGLAIWTIAVPVADITLTAGGVTVSPLRCRARLPRQRMRGRHLLQSHESISRRGSGVDGLRLHGSRRFDGWAADVRRCRFSVVRVGADASGRRCHDDPRAPLLRPTRHQPRLRP